MSTPKIQPLLLPALRAISDGNEHLVAEIRERVAKDGGPAIEERTDIHPKSGQNVYVNEVAFALAYLNMGKAITKVRKGCYQIATRGTALLESGARDLSIKQAKDA